MLELIEEVKVLETKIWDAAKEKNGQKFMEYVDENAMMICGGYPCTGMEYGDIIREFDLKSYEITEFKLIVGLEKLAQVHYMIKTEVEDEKNADLAGVFHVTSTWRKQQQQWKLIFNMDERVPM